jgi:hypothetical protein
MHSSYGDWLLAASMQRKTIRKTRGLIALTGVTGVQGATGGRDY